MSKRSESFWIPGPGRKLATDCVSGRSASQARIMAASCATDPETSDITRTSQDVTETVPRPYTRPPTRLV
ncbi:MAG: hypothetical protein Kilf2KO_21090 [Rhodospirillales bacterium]